MMGSNGADNDHRRMAPAGFSSSIALFLPSARLEFRSPPRQTMKLERSVRESIARFSMIHCGLCAAALQALFVDVHLDSRSHVPALNHPVFGVIIRVYIIVSPFM